MTELFDDSIFRNFDHRTIRGGYIHSKWGKHKADDDHKQLKVLSEESEPDAASLAALLGGAALLAADLATSGAISVGSVIISGAGVLIGGRDFAKATGKMRRLYEDRLLELEARAVTWARYHNVSVTYMDLNKLDRAR